MSLDEKTGARFIDEIIKARLFKAECAHDKDHGCIVVWSSGAAEQLEGLVNEIMNESKRKKE